MPRTTSQKVLNLYDARTQFSALVDRASFGEEFIIAKAGRPMARLVPFRRAPEPRRPGGWTGKVRISDDFDDPLPNEILAAFEGRGE